VFDRLRFQNLHDERLLEAQVEKDNFHQFNSDFHKEKEMVDFRKWLLTLAVVGVLVGLSSSAASAQPASQTITCTTSNGVNTNVRAEGIAELLGDLVLNCTGGITTTAGSAVPLENITLSINTYITSRLVGAVGSNTSEALMMIDEPYPSSAGGNPAPPVGFGPPTAGNAQLQLACLANNSTACAVTSKGLGIGTPGNYDGSPGHPNIFQGVQSAPNAITWLGVPIDAPGTGGGTRVIRFTNIRGNAFNLGISSTLVSTTISAIISVNGSATLSINQGSGGTAIGTVIPGMVQPPGVSLGSIPGAALYQQCNSVNTYLIPTPNVSPTDSGIAVSVTEGFAYSFRPQSYGQLYNVNTLHQTTYSPPGTFYAQNIPGFNYNSESGFAPGAGTTPGITGLVEPSSGSEAVGFADHGTQIQFTINGVNAGVSLYAPAYVYLTGNYNGATAGVAVLVQSGGITSGIGGGTGGVPIAVGGSIFSSSLTPTLVPLSGTSTTLTYEIYYSNPNVTETLTVPISVEYTSNTGSNIPAPSTTPATVGAEFAPQSTFEFASTGPVPRFGPSGSPVSLFSISPCSCNLLFPFVTNIAGFDTGVAIANTSSDPFGTSPQTGTVTLNYYGTTSGGGAAPPKSLPLGPIAGGQELIFTLSNGGNFGTQATPGFEGYIIAQANFQYCHGFAFISDVGAQKLAEGYLAIELDTPFGAKDLTSRTHNTGENKGN
jgi:hypothetical protein